MRECTRARERDRPAVTSGPELTGTFEQVVVPFLNDAYTLARYLARNEHDAQDIVHDAFLRALRYFDRQVIDNPRAWILTIVRRTCYTRHAERRAGPETDSFDDAIHVTAAAAPDPEALAIAASTRERLLAAIEALPPRFREVLILREIQELSYREIGQIIDAPIGTVMSRLSRARLRMQVLLGGRREAAE